MRSHYCPLCKLDLYSSMFLHMVQCPIKFVPFYYGCNFTIQAMQVQIFTDGGIISQILINPVDAFDKIDYANKIILHLDQLHYDHFIGSDFFISIEALENKIKLMIAFS